MRKIKEYLVKSNRGNSFNTWIVRANNAKEAINKVWEYEGFDAINQDIRRYNRDVGYQATAIYTKYEFTAKSLDQLRDRDVLLVL